MKFPSMSRFFLQCPGIIASVRGKISKCPDSRRILQIPETILALSRTAFVRVFAPLIPPPVSFCVIQCCDVSPSNKSFEAGVSHLEGHDGTESRSQNKCFYKSLSTYTEIWHFCEMFHFGFPG